MIWSLIGAIAAAVFFGVATVLQAVAARSAPQSEGVDPRLLARLLGRLPFVVGVALDLLGFVAELAALRSLPLFVVQAAIAGNLAVTAVTAVCAGLAMLGLAAGHESPAHVSVRFKLVLLGCVAIIAVSGVLAGRLRGRSRSAALGVVAGLGFGFVAVGSRLLTSLSPLDVLTDPATYVLACGGLVAFLFLVTALQRGSVTMTTGAVVVAETLMPALFGVLLLGDGTRQGYLWAAVLGFVLAVSGALALARFGEPSAAPA